MADFFVWLEGTEDNPIRRLAVTPDVARTLEQVLTAGAAALLGVQELVPLNNEPFRPDETEAWVIEDFDVPEFLTDAFGNPIGVAAADRSIQHGRVKCLVGAGIGDDDEIIAFQVMDRRQMLTARGLSLILHGDVFRKLEDPGLLIGADVHAALTTGRFVFKSLWWARRIFDLGRYYIEATDEQLEAFAARSDILIRDPAQLAASSQWERKRISYVMQSGLLDETAPREIREKASEYGIEVQIEGEGDAAQLVIPEDSGDRRRLLKFLEEDYYQGALTETKYVANSKHRIG